MPVFTRSLATGPARGNTAADAGPAANAGPVLDEATKRHNVSFRLASSCFALTDLIPPLRSGHTEQCLTNVQQESSRVCAQWCDGCEGR